MVFEDNRLLPLLYGQNNGNLKRIEAVLPISLHTRGNEITIRGEHEDRVVAAYLLEQLYSLCQNKIPIDPEDIERALFALRETGKIEEIFHDRVLTGHGKTRRVAPRSLAQKRYVDAIRKHDLVFGIGPAGTGKTYLAMGMAVRALQDKTVDRIILTRPAVEAGERLGFLPGTLAEKVNPYLRPLYDALFDMVGADKSEELIQRGVIEVAPLAFMRGRTLSRAFVILDEAQNTSPEQMKMFLTRIGLESKAVVTGDVTQVDLPHGQLSGLRDVMKRLKSIPEIAFCSFSDVDVVRHSIVQKIIRAYEESDASKAEPISSNREG